MRPTPATTTSLRTRRPPTVRALPDRTISSRSPALKAPVGVGLSGSVLYSTSGTTADGPPSIFVLDALKGKQKPRQVVTGSYLALPIGVALGP